MKSIIDRHVKDLEGAVGNLKNDVLRHNSSVASLIKQSLSRKKQRANAASGAVAALGIPVKRVNATPTFTVPAKRRKKPAHRPAVETGKY